MKYLTISGDSLKEGQPVLNGKHYTLYTGDGELLGVCSKPGITESDPDKKITIHCRDFVSVLEINKQKIIEYCEAKLVEKQELGIKFLTPYFSNMLPINFKFRERLSVEGPVGKLWFFLLVN